MACLYFDMTALNKNRPIRFPLALAGLAAGAMTLGGCSSDNDDSGPQAVTLNSLSGLVRVAGGAPLPGVTVNVAGETAITDSGGFFVMTGLGSLPVGMVAIDFDGSTATATGPLDFPELEIMVPLLAGTTELTLPQVITLPDLNNADSANQSLTLNGDGTAAEAIDVVQMGGMTAINLSGAIGTLVTIDGMVGVAGADLNVTPVAPEEVPMPLPDGLQGNAFVTIQPGNARFDQPDPALPDPPISGLDIVLPDVLGLPIGTVVDIWSFDHVAGAWVNRSEETGQTGTVELDGAGPATRIVATGVITEGGWHTAVLPVDPTCGTRVTGFVKETGTDNGIAGASVAFGTGQFATTDSDGSFTSPVIPAYDATDLINEICTPTDLSYEIVLPPSFGGDSSGTLTIMAADIVEGGTTDIGDSLFTLGTTGSVAGVVIGANTMGEDVSITPDGGAAVMVTPNGSGAFFQTGLEAGPYTASFLFDGASAPTEVPFTVVPNGLVTIAVQDAVGSGSEDITVLILQTDGDDSDLFPVAGATVRLQGTDSTSSAGLIMMTDANGEAVFADVDGPYNVTAQKDIFANALNLRFATSLVGIDPTGTTIGIPILNDSNIDQVTTDATLSGTVSNLPTLMGSEDLQITAIESGTSGDGFSQSATVDSTTGAYTLSIPSDTPLDVYVIHRDLSATSQVLATLIDEAVGMTTTGNTLTADLDFANAIGWNESVMVSLVGEALADDLFIDTCLRNDATGFTLRTPLHAALAGSVVDVTLNLPDLGDTALAGYTFRIDGELQDTSTSNFSGRECAVVVADNATTSTLTFLDTPTLTSPMDNASLTLAQLQSLQVAYNPSTVGPLGNNGVDFFILSYLQTGGGVPSGIDGAIWEVIVPPGQAMFDLPPAGLPMFGEGIKAIDAEIGANRWGGVSVDFTQFFDEDLATGFLAIDGATESCESYSELEISTQ